VFDRAMKAVAEIVDLPDRRASLLVRHSLQNRGEVSKKKRASEFPELTEDEVSTIEAVIWELKDF
ncbi:MAG: cell filamentation protein Fic, partial [Acidobacteriota bacterium]|nr:cell filamentation protein Fic [Acidobacteriota bacterium]